MKKPFAAFVAVSLLSALLPAMATAQNLAPAPEFSGVATVRYSGGTSNGNSIPAHVTFPQTCENPQIVTQTYTGGGKCALSPCPNTPHSTSSDIRSSIGNVTTSGFDVYATADDAIVAQDIQIGWHVICGQNNVVRPASTRLVSGTATVRYDGSHQAHSNIANISLPANCGTPSITAETHVSSVACNLGYTGSCYNNAGTTSTDLYPQLSGVNASGFGISTTSDDAISPGAGGNIKMSYHVMCQNPVRETSNKFMFGGVTQVTYGNDSHSSITHVTFPRTCKNPTAVAQSYVDGMKCVLYGGACNNNRGTTSSDIYAYAINLTETGMDVFLSADDVMAGGGRVIDIGYHVTCDEALAPTPQCRDGIDNDNDGKVDFPSDPGCTNPDDNDETNQPLPQCSDGIDNVDPEDTLADFNDPGCYTNGIYNPQDNDESNVTIICSTNADCGTNGFVGGPFCSGNTVTRNFITYTCLNPGTAQSSCTSSTAPQTQQTCSANQTCSGGTCINNQNPQCSDGVDNADPEDTLADAQDPGCYTNGVYNPQDNDETNVVVTLPACSDGLDNDNDGKVDFFDPGCYPNGVFNPPAFNPNDNDESNAAQLCRWARVNNTWVRQCN